MATANVNEPDTVKTSYPREVFEHDARLNSNSKSTVHHGLLILSKPDGSGTFSIARANRPAGGAQAEIGSVFLCPFMGAGYGSLMQNDTAYGGSVEKDPPPADEADPYSTFIEDVITAARTADFPDPSGRDDERLRGFHGG